MTSTRPHATVAVIGGGVVGAAISYTLAHRGVDVLLLEREDDLAYAASGTNSGVLHTGFDSLPGELETHLILRAAQIRPAVLAGLGVPVAPVGAELVPRHGGDEEVVAELVANAATNGVSVSVRDEDGALLVPGESVTDPVAFTLAMAASAGARGARVETSACVVSITDPGSDVLELGLADGRTVTATAVINAAGLFADEVAGMVGDRSFEIYPRKGEFFVFSLPGSAVLDRILLPVPTKRTKGVLVFPTLDGRVIAGPTAVDLDDKDDWSVRDEAADDVLPKAFEHLPALRGLEPVASYAGLRPAGRGSNYVIRPSDDQPRLVHVAAIRSTGLTASLGIAEHVAELLPSLGIDVTALEDPTPISPIRPGLPWWRRSTLQRIRTA